ncbi:MULTISPECIES: encapsulin-associated ferritin-like protein [unclassified Pseudofrankia]|uniref:encapsulin-associated ferritin-like protein n=1 Tax=unclassified Pseudofrankia TaxID=2994372 RepID=UPI0008DAADEE|nr:MULTISPECIES: ferritin-like domain-containing protein [unclassified Pseudofrankia]MDT3442062.1 ferritin-like domain-containing protein [Pseudofrankia sp. BMG5.37]OHV47283.1 ferritin [Pseudofrankia sp. BMG5.36]
MADSSMGLHEQPDKLTPELVDRHRAIVSLMEELEAVDWYDQRVSAATDPELADILAHNRDEEKEHAAMTLEWLRRQDAALDQQLRTYLFSEGPVLEAEARAMNGDGAAEAPAEPGVASPAGADHSLGIGGLKGKSE